MRKNYEFIAYVGVIVLLFILILFTNKRVNYPNLVLWGLAVWGFLHMSGGALRIGSEKIYGLVLIPIVGEPYNILRYDHLGHIFGFGVATLVMFVLLKPLIKFPIKNWWKISLIIMMAGMGVGAFNEVVEFVTTVFVSETGVGGYINTSLDLVSNLIGACLAMLYIQLKKGEI